MAAVTIMRPQFKRVFRLFISYAREDAKIAIPVSNALKTTLGPSAEVFIDSGLPYGLDFEEEIRKKLDETDVLVVIDSEALKPAYGWTGMELGWFLRTMEKETDRAFRRRIIPVYAEKPSEVLARHQGIKVGIVHSTLSMTAAEYEESLQALDYTDPTVDFLRKLQADVDRHMRGPEGDTIPHLPEQDDLPTLVRQMKLAIFSYLKTTPESTLKPQKQITIRTTESALNAKEGELPGDALLIPVGAGEPMSIFGLNSAEMDWGEFGRQTQNSKFHDSWLDAITNVVTSGKNLQIDNSQVILSNDESHTYRVILTTGTKYYNGVREYNLYFVEYLRPPDLGDPDTTVLLKGLNLFCRFRFMFLEKNSEFSAFSCQIAKNVAKFVREMERELNLLYRDSMELGLDKGHILAPYVDTSRIVEMVRVWRPLETRIRDLVSQIRAAGSDVEQFREPMAAVLIELEHKLRSLNADAIAEMAEKLKRPVQTD